MGRGIRIGCESDMTWLRRRRPPHCARTRTRWLRRLLPLSTYDPFNAHASFSAQHPALVASGRYHLRRVRIIPSSPAIGSHRRLPLQHPCLCVQPVRARSLQHAHNIQRARSNNARPAPSARARAIMRRLWMRRDGCVPVCSKGKHCARQALRRRGGRRKRNVRGGRGGRRGPPDCHCGVAAQNNSAPAVVDALSRIMTRAALDRNALAAHVARTRAEYRRRPFFPQRAAPLLAQRRRCAAHACRRACARSCRVVVSVARVRARASAARVAACVQCEVCGTRRALLHRSVPSPLVPRGP
jgi:hypothetical protein